MTEYRGLDEEEWQLVPVSLMDANIVHVQSGDAV